MLEHVPAWLGAALKNVRAGHDRLILADPSLLLPGDMVNLSSPAFANRARLPERFTADGAGVSPPLQWSEPPPETRSFALIVEDPDAPVPNPLVHAILWDIPASIRTLDEGAIVSDSAGAKGGDVGRNSFLREGWLPPDPPTGHGEHDYVFQLFALSTIGAPSASPGRGDFLTAIGGRILAAGVLVGTYSRSAAASAASTDLHPQTA